jgi:serine/threonine-protein kinase RsbW
MAERTIYIGAHHDVTLRVPPKAEYLALCRLVLAGIARVHGIDDETVADLKLAITEACSNAIRHAYPADADGDIELRIDVGDGRVTIEVADTGRGFELVDPPASPSPHMAEEGMGLAIIRGLVDVVELDSSVDGGGSRLRLVKKLAAPATPGV